MKNSTKIAISLLSLAAIPFVSGCGSSTEQVKETSSSTTYIPSPPQQVRGSAGSGRSLPAELGYNHRGKERVEFHRYG